SSRRLLIPLSRCSEFVHVAGCSSRWMEAQTGSAWKAACRRPEDAWVTRVYASRFDPGAAHVTKSRRRQNDFRAFVFRTASGANVIVEDTVDPNLSAAISFRNQACASRR